MKSKTFECSSFAVNVEAAKRNKFAKTKQRQEDENEKT
jgi:hypothetical protein